MIKYFKGYFKGYLKKIIKEVIAEGPKDLNLTKYRTTLFKIDKNIWNVIQTQELEEISLDLEYFDENNIKRGHKRAFKSLMGYYQFIESFTDEDLPDDLQSIKMLYLRVWYKYKGERELESHRFTNYNSVYKKDIVQKSLDNHKKYILDNMAEYLL